MDFKKQVQLVHTRNNEQFRQKYLNTQNSNPTSFINENDILFNEVSLQPNHFTFMRERSTPRHRHNTGPVRDNSCQLTNKEFEGCFIVDIT